jgi:hypothetical protein
VQCFLRLKERQIDVRENKKSQLKRKTSQMWWLTPIIPVYSGGRDQEDHNSRSAQAKLGAGFTRPHFNQWLGVMAHPRHPSYMGKHKKSQASVALSKIIKAKKKKKGCW